MKLNLFTQKYKIELVICSVSAITFVAIFKYLYSSSAPLTADQNKTATPVAVFQAQKKDLLQTMSFFSPLQPWNEAVIRPQSGLAVRDVQVRVGEKVITNQVLFRMGSEAQKLRNSLEQIEFRLRKLDYTVAMALARKNFLSKKEAEQKELEHQAEVIRSQLSELENGGVFRSPIDGIVAEISMKPGDFIDGSSNSLIRIVNTQRTKVSFWLPQSVIAQVSLKSEIKIKLDNIEAEAIMTAIAPTVDIKTGSIYAEAEITKPNQAWKIGQFVEAILVLKKTSNSLVIPKSAVIEEKGKYYVYQITSVPDNNKRAVASTIETANKKEIKIGTNSGATVEITDGLEAFDQVVTEGLSGLKDGTPVDITEVQ